MPFQKNLSVIHKAPQSMPVLPGEVVDMIFQALEVLVSCEESVVTAGPDWHAVARVHECFDFGYASFVHTLSRHWALISLVSRFWLHAVNNRRLQFPTILNLTSAKRCIQTPSRFRRICKISVKVEGDHTFSEILVLGRDTLQSIILRQGLLENPPSIQAWESLSQVKHLRELTINQSVSIPLPSLLNLLDYCRNLEALSIFSLAAGLSSQPDPLIDKLQNDEQKNSKLKRLTCHVSSPCHLFLPYNPLHHLLRRGRFSLETLTLVFESLCSTQDPHLEDEDEHQTNLMVGYFHEIFRGYQNLQTLRISTLSEMPSVPLMDRTISLFPMLEHLHLKGNSYSPELFTANLLPKTLKTLSCQAYSRPISTLARAIRNSLSHQPLLESITITTYRRKPRNFREAIYGELDLPHQTTELTMEELLLWDQCETKTIIEQKLLIQECQLRAIRLDGPRPYVPY